MAENKQHSNLDLTKKEFLYRGKTLAELKKLDVREFAKYLPSRERRSVLRHFEVIEQFVKKFEVVGGKDKQVKTHLRDLVIVPGMIGQTIKVHNGKEFVATKITMEMLSHRLGEFAATRKRVTHGAAGIGATRSSASRSVK
ncbi:MAG: 30S ribosomal protein S19 [Nanoarchaeota archaeon]